MERGVQGGRWNKKAPAGTTLLLMCLFIPTLTLLQPSEEQTCPRGDYLTDEGICCDKCNEGFRLVEKCHATGQRSTCAECPNGQYTDQKNFSPKCRSCRRCKIKHEMQVSKCEKWKNTICRCEPGYFRFHIDSETYECRKCTQCGPDEKEKQKCTAETNTVCECTENYYKVNRKCAPCKNCTTECRHHCASLPTLNTRAPDEEHLINVIAGVAVVALVLLVLVILVTYMVTKRSTKKKLLRLTTQSNVSSGSCQEVLIHSEGPSNTISVKATPHSPVSEQEQLSYLPDCVPLEIKTSGLIYTVLDLVPSVRVKQLVRSLGVRDTEIEQAEMDHQSCREAHYQMMRVWIERGSHAGGGGRDGMLHWPLLQELLDKLRKMHLGRAAEELETKYSIQ